MLFLLNNSGEAARREPPDSRRGVRNLRRKPQCQRPAGIAPVSPAGSGRGSSLPRSRGSAFPRSSLPRFLAPSFPQAAGGRIPPSRSLRWSCPQSRAGGGATTTREGDGRAQAAPAARGRTSAARGGKRGETGSGGAGQGDSPKRTERQRRARSKRSGTRGSGGRGAAARLGRRYADRAHSADAAGTERQRRDKATARGSAGAARSDAGSGATAPPTPHGTQARRHLFLPPPYGAEGTSGVRTRSGRAAAPPDAKRRRARARRR